jgi:coniferyl-aldehyde dehydrogenase
MTATEDRGGRLRLDRCLTAQRAAFLKDPYPDQRRRKDDLLRLHKAVVSRRDAIIRALDQDFGGRSSHETILTEILMVANTIRYARRRLSGWMRPRRRHVPLVVGMGRAQVLPQPLGVVGIIAPWNAPLQLSLSPLAAAIAAGNRVMLKASEHAPATADLVTELLGDVFPEDKAAVATGDASVAKTFAALPFDHLLYTGSGAIGREVMRAAAEHLVPVTLELGGKSPALIAPDADLRQAAADIVFGKLLNAGQTCIAPDYVLAPRDSLPALIDALTAASRRMYPGGRASPDYTGIIDDQHRERLVALLEGAKACGRQPIALFSEDPDQVAQARKFPPCLIVDPPSELAIMREEIFGPILVIKPYRDLDEALAFINARPRPLALYLFSRDRRLIDRVARATCSGALLVNDTMVHAAIDDLPFGGAGASGIGRYHGPEGFETFSQMKPIFRRGWPRIDRLARAPFNHWKMRIFQWLL